jgi:acetyltransferase-like isoleucine patch superfamily enzyme
VTLGKGCLVGAYSYVQAGEYPDFSILKGNPAKIVGDTRDMDAPYLAAHPELRETYLAWAQSDEN